MGVTIEKDVPPPPPHAGYGGSRWPWESMEVGDSIAESDPRSFHSCQASAHAYGRRHGLKFKTQRRTENNVRVMRVWRIK